MERPDERGSRRSSRTLLILAAFLLVVTGCSKDEQAAKPPGPATSQNPEAPFAAMDPVNASVAFASDADQRDGWWWVGGGHKARWSYGKFPTDLTDLRVDVTAMVDAATAEPTRGAPFELAYGQGDTKLGNQSVSLPLSANPTDAKTMIATGTVALPKSTLPDGLSSLWLEATTANGPALAVRADSMHFGPLALSSQAAGAGVAGAPRPTTTKGPTTKPSGTLTGDFTSDGDPISGWYWLRDPAGARSGSWVFTGVPDGDADFRLEFDLLATDGINGGPGVAAQFYLDYAVGGPGTVSDSTTGTSRPPTRPSTSQPPARPSVTTVPPPQTQPTTTTTTVPATTGANTQLVSLTNTSPPGDPVGYTNTGTVTIPRAKIPIGTRQLAVKITRADANGANVVSDHVAVRQEAVKLAWGTGTTTTTAPATTSTTAATSTTTTGGGGETTTTLASACSSDIDLTDDANTMDEAAARCDLANGEYHGTLQGEDDDWFAFQMAETQLVDIAVVPTGGATIDTELYNPSRLVREPRSGAPNQMAFTHAAPRGGGGRWFLHLHRRNGVDTSYTFTLNVRDANDGNRGVDAGEDAASAMAVTYQTFYGEIVWEDTADNYKVQLGAGMHVTATLTPLTGANLEMALLPPTGPSYADETTGGAPLTLEADAGTSATTVRIAITPVGTSGGKYKLKLVASTSSDCVAPPVAPVSFSTSGAVTSRVVHRDGDGNPTDEILWGREPINDSAWRWLQANAPQPDQQTAQWVFDQLPNGDDDYRFAVDFPLESTAANEVPDGAVYVTYGTIPGSGVDAMQGGDLVGLTNAGDQSVTGISGRAEVVVPHGALAGATQGIWVRVGLADPTVARRPSALDAGVGLGQTSVQLCVGTRGTSALSGVTPPPKLTVSPGDDARTVIASSSIFTDPVTDIDHDGLNQDFENAAADLVNPVIELDEEEMWLHNRSQERTVNFVKVSPYPSSVHPTYVIFSYLNTWSYDPGGGVQQPFVVVDENHRGDSERIYTAWRVIDDHTLHLEWVSTSAHGGITDHSGVWNVADRVCNTANWAAVSVSGFSFGGNEPMCSNLTFDGDGHLVMYTSENKHAMYPTKGLCNSVSIGRVNGVAVYGENCGWDPGSWPWSWKESDFSGDPRYLGNGRWHFHVYNVGEKGYRLIDYLDNPDQWRGLTGDQVAQLLGEFPNEAVWSGNTDHPDKFCGGVAAGASRIYPPGDTYPGDASDPTCSGWLGQKYESVPAALDAVLRARYRIEIKTGDVDGAGTDEKIFLQVQDDAATPLTGIGDYLGDLERGATDVLWLPAQRSGGPFTKLVVSRTTDDGTRPDWYLASITVEDKVAGTIHTFPANRWVSYNQPFTLSG